MKYSALSSYVLLVFLAFLLTEATAQKPLSRMRVVATPTPTVAPTPTPTVAPTPTTTSTPRPTTTSKPEIKPTQYYQPQIQTLDELQTKIRQILQRESLKRSRIGIKILSLDTGKTLFEEDAEKFFMPASNMKNFTVAAALEKLTPNFTFITSVYATEKPDSQGILKGDLIIYGRGDPTIAYGIDDKDEIKGLEKLVERIIATGIKRIEGNIIGDESFFTGTAIPYTWEWEDLQWYYGAPISALTINDNAAKILITPASKVGAPAIIQLLPPESGLVIVNNTETSEENLPRKIVINRKLGTNVLIISGSIAKNAKPFESFVSIPNPAMTFVSILRALLEKHGVVITGKTEVLDSEARKINPLPKNLLEIARLESPPLSLIAQKTMKPSQNLYTELILRAMGENILLENYKPEWNSADKGIAIVDKFLNEIGVSPGSVLMYDGSGLSRHNLVTPNAIATLYSFMANKSKSSKEWLESLTVAGVDGTLSSRFKGTLAERNVRGKTGTINQVSSLSGYVNSISGEKFAFSIIINNAPDQSMRVSTIDEIVLLLANFAGKTN